MRRGHADFNHRVFVYGDNRCANCEAPMAPSRRSKRRNVCLREIQTRAWPHRHFDEDDSSGIVMTSLKRSHHSIMCGSNNLSRVK